MTKPTTLKIDDIEYVRADQQKPAPVYGPRVIVKCLNANDFTGYMSDTTDSIVLEQAAVIRRWGTTGGLGQLSISGPTSTTVLDPLHGNVLLNKNNVIAIIPCSEKWK